MRAFLVLLFVALVASTVRAAVPVPVGPGQFDWEGGGTRLTVFTYKPAQYRDGPLFVVFHGVGRNAAQYRDYAQVLAEKFGALVVVPLFDKERFPRELYQRGGIVAADGRPRARADWTYALLPQLVAHLRARESRPALPYYFIGHSAGGQFLVRLAAFLPGGARRIVAANPGSHVFPTRDQSFPYGFGGLPEELANDAALRAYLAAPLTIYLGTADNISAHSMDESPEAMRQGPNRLARGRACFEAAQKLARERGWEFNWRKVETPGVDHNGAKMFAAPEAREAIFGP